MHQHRVEAEPAAAGHPLRPVGMVPESFDEGEVAATILAAEECRRLDARVDDVRFVGWARG